MLIFAACSDDAKIINPSTISQLRAESREGAILLKWEVPVDSNYHYIRLNAFRVKDNHSFSRNISVYTDSILITNLLARHGEYHFELHTISSTDTHNPIVNEISCTALPVKPVETKYSRKLELIEGQLSSNAQEKTEGPISNLVDGNLDSFFHSSWSESIPAPHWIDIALEEPIENFEFKTWNRKGSGSGNAEIITMLGSNDGLNWTELTTLWKDIPSGGGAKYESPVINCGQPYSYIRYRADACYGHDWFNMGELELYNVWYDIYDPENESE